MKVLGYQHKVLSFQDGRSVSGCFLFLGEERNGVTGIATDRIFISDVKAGGYQPVLNDEVKVYYNRYGKVDAIEQL